MPDKSNKKNKNKNMKNSLLKHLLLKSGKLISLLLFHECWKKIQDSWATDRRILFTTVATTSVIVATTSAPLY